MSQAAINYSNYSNDQGLICNMFITLRICKLRALVEEMAGPMGHLAGLSCRSCQSNQGTAKLLVLLMERYMCLFDF